MGNEYSVSDIQYIEPREHMRLRPGMYLIGGTTQYGLHCLLLNVLDRAANEKNCKNLIIRLEDNVQITISDDGFGLPVEKSQETGEYLTELAFTKTTIGGPKKYYDPIYPFTTSMGIEITNALSAELHIEIKRDGYLWGQSYEAGLPQTEFRQIRPLAPDEPTGSTVTFRPDFTVFEPNEFDYDYIANRMNQVAYCVPELSITVSDERSNHKQQSHTFHHPDGVAGFIKHLNRDHQPLHEPIVFSKKTQIPGIGLYSGEPQDVIVDVAIQYVTDSRPAIFSYINGEYFSARSEFELELMQCVERQLNQPFSFVKSSFERLFIQTEDVLSGLNAVISIWHPYPEFESNTLIRLVSAEPAALIRDGVPQAFETFRETQPEQYQRIVAHIEAQMHTRDHRRRVEL